MTFFVPHTRTYTQLQFVLVGLWRNSIATEWFPNIHFLGSSSIQQGGPLERRFGHYTVDVPYLSIWNVPYRWVNPSVEAVVKEAAAEESASL
jgi:hypothetical protein